jgi:hypothetical protein
MITPPNRLLRDSILAEARARGVPLAEETFKFEQGLPVLRLRLGERVLRGVHVGFPGSSRDLPDVITVHGSGFRASRMWPRKRDGSFNINAVVDRLLALVRAEVERPHPDLAFVAKNVPAAVSGLHVMHLGAVLLGAMTTGSSPEDLVARVGDEERRTQLLAHMHGVGLLDSDLRALGDAAGVCFGRARKLSDTDPFQPIRPEILTMLKLGRPHSRSVERRFALLLQRRGNEITIADPADEGIVGMNLREIEAEWKLGASKGSPWLGRISCWERPQAST